MPKRLGHNLAASSLATVAAALLPPLGALPAAAQGPVAHSPEFQVNTYTTNSQRTSSVTADAAGDFVVVWQSNGSFGTDINGYSIQGQRFASDGSALGSQFQVNTYTTSVQALASVTVAGDGDFVVVWNSLGSFGTDSGTASIQGQRFASDGSALASQFQVNTYTTSSQLSPSAAAAANGDFVVVWMSGGSAANDDSSSSVQGQRYASDGSALGGEFQVNTYTTNGQGDPSVAMGPDGFVVVWQSNGSPGSDQSSYSIQGQRYASDGSALGTEFQVNTYTTSQQNNPRVAADEVGDFVVVWGSYGSVGDDSSLGSIQGQRYASDGSALGGEFQVNTYTTSEQYLPSVAAEPDGDFVVVWQNYGPSGTDTDGHGIQGQRYVSNGAAAGGEFQVNTYTAGGQYFPSVAATANGDFVVAWESDGSVGTDTSGSSVQGQRYVPEPDGRLGLPACLTLLVALRSLDRARARRRGREKLIELKDRPCLERLRRAFRTR